MDHKITTISTLSSLVDQDKTEHVIKDLARLFITAMVDWPSMGQIEIKDFLTEIKEYFGVPLTIEKLADVKLDMHTAHYWWRRESATSLIRMLQLSEKINPERDFDTVTEAVLNYYEKGLSTES